jgi:hypothetical protein
MKPSHALTLVALVLAACGPTERQKEVRQEGAGAASPPVPPVFVMAQVVAADTAAHTITVRASSGATALNNTPSAGAAAAPGDTSTLSVDHSAHERLAQVKPGDVVSLTCNMVKTPGMAGPPPSPAIATCGSVTSISKQGGALE